MKNRQSIWGIVLLLFGVIWALSSLDIFDIDMFFDGWWTLFIIIPSIINIVRERDKKGGIICLIIGLLLLLSCQDIISFEIVGKLIFPIIIIIIGLSLLFKNLFNKEIEEEIKKINNNNEGVSAIFSGQDINYDNEEFTGKDITAIFGGVDLDLRDAIIKKDVIINVSTIFAGVNIRVSNDVNIKVKSDSIFGGVDTKKRKEKADNKYTIYINAKCIFGGVEIK